MNGRFICATLLIVGMGMIGCGAPEPPMACTEETFPWWEDGDFTLSYCEELDMVCNEAVTLADECPGFLEDLEVYFREFLIPEIAERLEYFPWEVDLDRLADYLFGRLSGGCARIDILDQVGTCQPVGNEEDACLEDADCREDLVCLEGMCLPPPQEECFEDADCAEGLWCWEGECLLPG